MHAELTSNNVKGSEKGQLGNINVNWIIMLSG